MKRTLLLVSLLCPAPVFANEQQPLPTYTGAQRFNESLTACVECHSGTANSSSGRVVLTFNGQAATTYTPGATIPIQITITDTGGGRMKWGFELTARFANGPQAGTLAVASGTTNSANTTVFQAPSNQAFNIQWASHSNLALVRPTAATSFTYTINWTAPPSGSGDVYFNAAGNAANGNRTFDGDRIYTTEVKLSAAATSPPPAVGAGGVVNAATFQVAPNNQVARGQLISIFGVNLTSGGPFGADKIPLPTTLGNTSVQACGKTIPLILVAAGQINAQLPAECPDTGTTPLTVTAGGQTSTAENVNLIATSPGIFTVDTSGIRDGAILHGIGSALVTPANPAAAGEIVVIFCTGLGATNPAVASGTASNGEKTVAAVTVTIGGKDSPVQFAGLSPGFVGLYQINVVVPTVTGSSEVIITAGTTKSRSGVTMSVK